MIWKLGFQKKLNFKMFFRKGRKNVMKIGIDIDDTTFLTVKSMLKYADIFEEEISGVPN